jgi:hypothetical protein
VVICNVSNTRNSAPLCGPITHDLPSTNVLPESIMLPFLERWTSEEDLQWVHRASITPLVSSDPGFCSRIQRSMTEDPPPGASTNGAARRQVRPPRPLRRTPLQRPPESSLLCHWQGVQRLYKQLQHPPSLPPSRIYLWGLFVSPCYPHASCDAFRLCAGFVDVLLALGGVSDLQDSDGTIHLFVQALRNDPDCDDGSPLTTSHLNP